MDNKNETKNNFEFKENNWNQEEKTDNNIKVNGWNDDEDDFFKFEKTTTVLKKKDCTFKIEDLLFSNEEQIDQSSKDFYNFLYK